MRHFTLSTIITLGFHLTLCAQLFLDNASFEGKPQDATTPVGWLACEQGTTPDILPGPWGVYQEASDGDTYVGLITRDDGTWESIGQRLKKMLQPKDCYTFNLDLAHSSTYSGYNAPIRLRIWGGPSRCSKGQLLYESDFIKNSDWETHEVQFYVKQPINYILIEAYYKEGRFSHRGNILIDHITPLKACPRAMLELKEVEQRGTERNRG